MTKKSFELLDFFRRSTVLQSMASDEKRLRQMIRDDPRKIIPVAEVARWFGVSHRQIRLWIEQGWIIKPEMKASKASAEEGKRPARRKQGLTPGRLKAFLQRLREVQLLAGQYLQPVRRGRSGVVARKVREAYRNLTLEHNMTPVELARKIKASPGSVRRVMHQGVVGSRKPSPCRYRLVASSLAPRKRTKNKQLA